MIEIKITDDYGSDLAVGDVLLAEYNAAAYVGVIRVAHECSIQLDCGAEQFRLSTVKRPWLLLGSIDNPVLQGYIGVHEVAKGPKRDAWLTGLYDKLLGGLYVEPRKKHYRRDAIPARTIHRSKISKGDMV